MSAQEFLNYIDGEFTPAQSKANFQKLNPFTGEVLGAVASSDAMDVIRAIQAAKRAQTEYEKWTLEQRAELLNKIATQLEEKSAEYAFKEALHQGLPLDFVLEKSVQYSIHQFRAAAAAAVTLSESKAPNYQVNPTGLLSLILSWNLSLRLLSERLAPALAAGNVCLIKVSELSPITAKIMGEVLTNVNAPKGLVQFLQGKGSEVGSMLAAHPSMRAVSFVGKLSNAEKVMQGALAQFKKMQICTGVKNSIFVLNEVDFENSLPKILESFLIGQGQLCWNTSRIFVLESFQNEFIEKLKAYLASLKPATSPRDKTAWWPVISEEVLTRLAAKAQQIKSEEGKLIVGGAKSDHPGFFFQPTVSLDLPNCSEMQQEEISGPILILTAVKYQHEMVKWANTGYYGHSAVIWAPNSEKALKLADKIDVGTISVNSWFPENFGVSHRQTSFGLMDMGPWERFYSDAKVLTGV